MISSLFKSSRLISGYYHIKLSPKSRYESAFATIFFKYEFLKMPIGLDKGPAYFIALMQEGIQLNLMTFVSSIMDDVLVHNASENDHLEHLKLIFQKNREAGLKLKLSKLCIFQETPTIFRTPNFR